MSKKKNKEEMMDKNHKPELEIDDSDLSSVEQDADPTKNYSKIHPAEVPGTDDPAIKQGGDIPMTELESCQMRIAELEATVFEYKDKYLRNMAEFENYRRRTTEEKSDWIKRATEKLALHICDVLDNFERALMQITEEQKTDSFIKGILMIEQQLKSALEKEGVKRIEALGHEFDPKVHEALAKIASEYEEDQVAAIIQNGYTMHDKLIRPVRVAVSTGETKI